MIQSYDIAFQRNSTEHKILHLLRDGNRTTMQIIKNFGKTQKTAANLRLQIGELARKKYVLSVGHDHWQLTELGVEVCLILGGEPTPRLRFIKNKIATGTSVEPYDGKELGQTCCRPGAYDFIELPSLMSGRQVWWRRDAKHPEARPLR